MDRVKEKAFLGIGKSTGVVLCMMIIVLFFAFGCEKLRNLRVDELIEVLNSSCHLQDTKWKLVGIVDTQTDSLKELEPKDCEECYSFTFYTDSTATGWSTSNILGVILRPTVRIFIMTYALGTDFYLEDAILFRNTIETITSYELSKNKLKFYFNDRKNYLLFEKK